MITVTVVYDIPSDFGLNQETDEIVTAVARWHGVEWDGSGSGFGERDHTFAARDEGQAMAFKLALQRAVPRARIAFQRGC